MKLKYTLNLKQATLLMLFLFSFINITPLPPLRLVDLFALSLFSFSIFSPFSLKMTYSFFIFGFFLLASCLLGLIMIGVTTPENWLFLYKYIAVFLAISISQKTLTMDKKSLDSLVSLLKLLIFLISITLLTVYFLSSISGVKRGDSIRLSFSHLPFHGDFRGDAHLFSAVYAVFLLFCAFFYTKKYELTLLLMIVFCGVLSGSRTFFVASFVGLIPYVRRLRAGFLIPAMIILIISSFYFWPYLEDLFLRAITINFSAPSEAGRVNKFLFALKQLAPSYGLIGIGMPSSELIWFDGGIPAILTSLGIPGLFAFLCYTVAIILSILNTHSGLKYNVLFMLFAILVSNAITEYFLVSRYLFPVVLLFHIALATLPHGDVKGGKLTRPIPLKSTLIIHPLRQRFIRQ